MAKSQSEYGLSRIWRESFLKESLLVHLLSKLYEKWYWQLFAKGILCRNLQLVFVNMLHLKLASLTKRGREKWSSELESEWREWAVLAKTKPWVIVIKRYFLIVSQLLRSKTSKHKQTRPLSALHVCVSVKQTQRQLRSSTHHTEREETEKKGKHWIKYKHSDVTWSLWVLTSHPAHWYWLGATHPLPKD